jgi:protein-disulfide isomerase
MLNSSYNGFSLQPQIEEAALNLKTRPVHWRFLGTISALLALALIVLGGAWAYPARAQAQAAASTKKPAKTSAKSVPKPAQAEQVGPPNKGVGSPTAPISIEVFSDYQCPMCGQLFEQTLRPMINDYVASGKVYLIHRDFPLPIADHRFNWDAARWGTAAAWIGKFEEVDTALYDNVRTWSADGNIQKVVASALNPADFKRVQKLVAGCLTQTPQEFRPPVQAGQGCSLDAYINQDIALGKQVPVQATPTYVISKRGQRLAPGSGFVSWPLMKQFLDSLLTQ